MIKETAQALAHYRNSSRAGLRDYQAALDLCINNNSRRVTLGLKPLDLELNAIPISYRDKLNVSATATATSTSAGQRLLKSTL